MSRRFLVLAAVVLASAAYAQRVAETVEVTVIEVPVTVVDRSGNPVRNLAKENFEVTDDGKRVPIEYFEVLDLPAIRTQRRQRAETPLPPAATRHFLVMFDLANSSPGTIRRAGEAAKSFVSDHLGETDLAAIATFTTEKGARMITNFTRNRTLLMNAIETLGHPNYFKVADPLMMSAVTSGGQTETRAESPRSWIDEAFASMARENQVLESRTHDNEMRDRLRIQLSNLGSVARALDRLTGQKQIVLLSEGFDASLVTGRENLSSSTAQAETADVLSGAVWNVDSEKRFGSAAATNDIDQMAELFRRSDVVLHAIDIKGLRGATDTSTMSGGGGGKSFESLYLLTKPTGGSVFKNANDLSEDFTRLMKQQEVVYLLGFSARSTGKPGKFHSLKVKMVNAGGARVTHRAGYYESSGMSDLERVLTFGDILMTDAPIDDIALNVTAIPLPGPSGRARVPVVVEIPGQRLLQGLTGKTATAQLFLYAFGKDSQVVDYVQDRITLDLTKAAEAVRGSGVRYYATLHLPPGEYAVKCLVRVDESGLIGFKRDEVAVPSFDRATVVPPVLFTDAGGWAMILGPSRGDDYPYPFAAGESKYIPKRDAGLSRSGEYTVALFLAGVPVDTLAVTPALVSADGGASSTPNLKLIGRTSPDERGLYKLLFAFDPKNLAAGRHILRFDVKTNEGVQSATLPFTVQ